MQFPHIQINKQTGCIITVITTLSVSAFKAATAALPRSKPWSHLAVSTSCGTLAGPRRLTASIASLTSPREYKRDTCTRKLSRMSVCFLSVCVVGERRTQWRACTERKRRNVFTARRRSAAQEGRAVGGVTALRGSGGGGASAGVHSVFRGQETRT